MTDPAWDELPNSVEPYGILVTAGDNDTFPLWYAQHVEGIRKDVVIAVTEPLNTEWYARQLVGNPVYAYNCRRLSSSRPETSGPRSLPGSSRKATSWSCA